MIESLEKAKVVGSQRGLSLCHHALGAVQYLMGKWQESIASYKQSIALGEQVGGLFGVVLGSQRLALVETRLGLYDQANERLLGALDLVENTDNTLIRLHSLTRILGTLAQNRLEAGDLAQAVAYVAKDWEAQKISGECIPCDVSLYPAAVPVYLALEDREAAAWATRRAEEMAANFGSQAWSATAVYLRGLLARSTGDLVQAGQCLKQALDLFEGLEQPYESALCMEALFDVGDAGAVGSTPDSDPPQDQPAYLLEQAVTIYARLGAARDEARARLKLAELESSK